MLSTLVIVWLLRLAAMVPHSANVLFVTHFFACGYLRYVINAALGMAGDAAIWSSSVLLGVNVLFQAFPGIQLFCWWPVLSICCISLLGCSVFMLRLPKPFPIFHLRCFLAASFPCIASAFGFVVIEFAKL
jgi:hypothetical protein